jgi:hypothetical protein
VSDVDTRPSTICTLRFDGLHLARQLVGKVDDHDLNNPPDVTDSRRT